MLKLKIYIDMQWNEFFVNFKTGISLIIIIYVISKLSMQYSCCRNFKLIYLSRPESQLPELERNLQFFIFEDYNVL